MNVLMYKYELLNTRSWRQGIYCEYTVYLHAVHNKVSDSQFFPFKESTDKCFLLLLNILHKNVKPNDNEWQMTDCVTECLFSLLNKKVSK